LLLLDAFVHMVRMRMFGRLIRVHQPLLFVLLASLCLEIAYAQVHFSVLHMTERQVVVQSIAAVESSHAAVIRLVLDHPTQRGLHVTTTLQRERSYPIAASDTIPVVFFSWAPETVVIGTISQSILLGAMLQGFVGIGALLIGCALLWHVGTMTWPSLDPDWATATNRKRRWIFCLGCIVGAILIGWQIWIIVRPGLVSE
jgi:hypothetical protein